MPNKRWSDLSYAQKGALSFSGVVQLGLLVAALVDIYRRPATQIWVAVSFVNFVGPISYFLFGRRR